MTGRTPCDPLRATKFILLAIAAAFGFAATSGADGFDLDANGRFAHNDIWLLAGYVAVKPVTLCIEVLPIGLRRTLGLVLHPAFWSVSELVVLGCGFWVLLAFGVFHWAKRRCERQGHAADAPS